MDGYNVEALIAKLTKDRDFDVVEKLIRIMGPEGEGPCHPLYECFVMNFYLDSKSYTGARKWLHHMGSSHPLYDFYLSEIDKKDPTERHIILNQARHECSEKE